jgi:hypothetical protein
MPRREFLRTAMALPALCPAASAQANRRRSRSDIEIVRLSTRRQQGVITYEGVLKLTADRRIPGLRLIFEFFATTKALLSMQKIVIEEGSLEPGEGHRFEVQGDDVPRAVSFRVSAEQVNGLELRLAGAGPYPLD